MKIDEIVLKEMLKNSYRKFKSYIYYSNGNEYLIEKISEFEFYYQDFDTKLLLLAKALTEEDNSYFDKMFDRINYQLMPKLANKSNTDESQISNISEGVISIEKVNFFIDGPIELFILDTFWTLLVGRLISSDTYNSKNHKAYLFDNNLYDLANNNLVESINFKSINLYQTYYKNYIEWKNRAVDVAEARYMNNKDSSILSLDLDSYYYKTNIVISKLVSQIKVSDESLITDYHSFKYVEELITKIYSKYSLIINEHRKDIDSRTILPIGLVSAGLLSNQYLLGIDKLLSSESGVLYYSRYVDDILIVLDRTVSKENLVLSSLFPTVFKYEGSIKGYVFHDFCNISVQKTKIKCITNSCKGPKLLLEKLRTQITNSSEPHLLANIDLSISDFLVKIYEENNDNLKIRETTTQDINVRNLMKFLSAYMIGRKNTFDIEEKEKKISKELFDQITKTFDNNRLIGLFTRWSKLLSFASLSFEKQSMFNKLNKMINDSIAAVNLKYEENDPYLRYSSLKTLNVKLKSNLRTILRVAKNQVTAISPKNARNEGWWKKIRVANMFKHQYVSSPLLNFYVELSGRKNNIIDYSREVSLNHNGTLDKSKLSLTPRFIYFSEYVISQIVANPTSLNNPNMHVKYLQEYNDLTDYFGGEKITEEKLSFKDSDINVYNNNYEIDQKVQIGLASINLSKHKIIVDRKINFKQTAFESKKELFKLLNDAYVHQTQLKPRAVGPDRYHEEREVYCKPKKVLKNIDFVLFPEVSIPLEWLNDVADFSRKSGIAIIAGLKYIRDDKYVYNSVATILPFESRIGYKNVFLSIRQKNDYAPEEIELIKDNGLKYYPISKPIYNIFTYKNIRFSVFNCYELTDIESRATLKNKVDILFSPQYNKDVNYFSSVIESTSRDLFAFVAQANSSEYGDTRIVAPLKTYSKNLAVISGGIQSVLHIGEIDFSGYFKYILAEKDDKYLKSKKSYLRKLKKIDDANDDIKKNSKYCATSARTDKKHIKRYLF